MFKPTAKAQVENKFRELFGKEIPFKVSGQRVFVNGKPTHYLSELIVEGNIAAEAKHSDWRKSYKLLQLEVEKLYADGLSLV